MSNMRQGWYTPTTEDVCNGFRGDPRKFEQAGEPIDAIGSNYGSKCYAAFHRWLAEHDAELQADAWDEGFTNGRDLAVSGKPMTRNNPYKEQNQ